MNTLITKVWPYCDQDKKESLVLQLAKWHEEFLRATEDLAHQKDRDRRIVTAYGSNLDYVPLQAADVIAHEIMRFARQHPAMKFVATNVSTGSVILDRLKMYGPSLVMCLSKRMLEAELDGSAWVPGHPHGYRFIPSAS